MGRIFYPNISKWSMSSDPNIPKWSTFLGPNICAETPGHLVVLALDGEMGLGMGIFIPIPIPNPILGDSYCCVFLSEKGIFVGRSSIDRQKKNFFWQMRDKTKSLRIAQFWA